VLLTRKDDKTTSWFLRSIAQGLKRGRLSFQDFCSRYFPHYQTDESCSFHVWLEDHLESATRTRNVKSVIIAPRGYAKSTVISVMYVLYCICEKLETYIVLFSDTQTQANQHLRNIKKELEDNELLAEDYPEACGEGETWSIVGIVTNNGIKVDVIGTHGKIRGRREGAQRPSLIIGDDPENDESAASPTQRDSCRTWFDSGVMKAGRPGTNIIVIGTMINSECLVAYLLKRPGWVGRIFRAICKWPDRMDLWEKWEEKYYESIEDADAFYQEHLLDLEKGAEVLWSKREPLIALMKMRAEGHRAFGSEKQNEPANPAQCRFEPEWFEEKVPGELSFDEPPSHAIAFAAVDPCVGKDARKGDYCAIVWGWWAPNDRHIYIDAVMERCTADAAVEMVIDRHIKFVFTAVGWESNGYQSVFAGQLAEKSAKRGAFLKVVEITHSDKKELRIERGLGPYLQRKTYKFRRSPGARLLLKQTRNYGIEDHDDGPDALEMLTTLVKDYAMARAA
jgi:predicted phage terminase large subunit-like protein